MMCDRMQSNIFLYYKTKTKTKPKKKYPPPPKKEDSVNSFEGTTESNFLDWSQEYCLYSTQEDYIYIKTKAQNK